MRERERERTLSPTASNKMELDSKDHFKREKLIYEDDDAFRVKEERK